MILTINNIKPMRRRIHIYFIFIIILNSVMYSQNYYSIESNVEGRFGENRTFDATVLKENTKLFTVKKNLAAFQSIPKAIVLANGNLVFLSSIEGVLEIYNGVNNLILAKDFYSLPPYNEQVIKYSINKLGIALLVSEHRINKIYFFNNNGKLEYQLNADNGLISGFTTSEMNNFLVYSTLNWNEDKLESKTYIIKDIDNNKIFNVYFEKGKFSDNTELFVGQTNKSTFCIRLNDQKLLWQTKLNSDMVYLETQFHDSAVLLLTAGAPQFINNNWVFKDAEVTKKVLSGSETMIKNITSYFNNGNLSKNGKEINLNIDGKSYTIESN